MCCRFFCVVQITNEFYKMSTKITRHHDSNQDHKKEEGKKLIIKAGTPLSSSEIQFEQTLFSSGKRRQQKRVRRTNEVKEDDNDDDNDNNEDEEEHSKNTSNTQTESFRSSAQLWLSGKTREGIEMKPIHQIAMEESIESLLCIPTRLFSHCCCLAPKAASTQQIRKRKGGAMATTKKIKDVCPWIILTAGESGVLCIWDPLQRQRIAVSHYGRMISCCL